MLLPSGKEMINFHFMESELASYKEFEQYDLISQKRIEYVYDTVNGAIPAYVYAGSKNKQHCIEKCKGNFVNVIVKYGKFEFSGFKCNLCGANNISYKNYIRYKGHIKLMKIVGTPPSQSKKISQSTNDWNQYSLLMANGYNVKSGELTKDQRQNMLKHIVEFNIMDKQEVIKNIQMKINFNGKQRNNMYAKKKWEEDLEFLKQMLLFR